MITSAEPTLQAPRDDIVPTAASPDDFLYPEPHEDQRIAEAGDDESDDLTLEELGERILSAHLSVTRAAETFVEFASNAGELLLKARRLVPAGEWGSWLQSNCEFSERTAQEYMEFARAPLETRRAAVSMRQFLSMQRNDRASDDQRDAAADNRRKGRPAVPRHLAWDTSRRKFIERTKNLRERLASDASLSPEEFCRLVRDTIAALEALLQ